MATVRVSVDSVKEAANKLEGIKARYNQAIHKIFNDGEQIAAICNKVSDNDFIGLLNGERVHLESFVEILELYGDTLREVVSIMESTDNEMKNVFKA